MASRYTTLIALCLTLGLAFPVGAADKVVLELKWFSQFQFAGYYTALEKGFYAEEGLTVEIRERDPKKNPIDLVADGESQFGVSDSSLILQRLRGKPVVVLAAIFQHSPLVMLTREEDGVMGPIDLKGKRIMRQKGVDDAVLTALFHQEGLSDEDVTDIPHSFDDKALLNGETDAMSAYLTNQPYLYHKWGMPIRILNPISYGVDFYGDMLFTNEKLIRTKPDLAVRFRRASLKGWTYALSHSEEVSRLLREKYNAKKELEHLLFEAEMTDRMIQPHLVDLGHFNPARVSWVANIYRAEGLAPLDAKLEGLYYEEYLGVGAAASKGLRWAGAIAAILLVSSLVLLALNRRLKTLVRAQTADLAKAKDNLQHYVDIVDRYVISSATDTKGRITHASEAFAKISKFSKDELIGKGHNIVRHPDMPREIYQGLWATIRAGKSWQGEIKNKARDGSAYWVDVHIDPNFDNSGKITGYTAIRTDITDKKRIEELSVTDRLTGLFNRLKLDEVLEGEFDRLRRYGHPLSVIMLDADHFKSVNDTYGHNVGDQVLVDIAQIIRDHVRAIDVPGRWGGEEFLVICSETDMDGAMVVAEKVREMIEAHDFPSVGHKTVSLGVAQACPDDTLETLVQKADEALYRAKEEGRNRVCRAAGGI